MREVRLAALKIWHLVPPDRQTARQPTQRGQRNRNLQILTCGPDACPHIVSVLEPRHALLYVWSLDPFRRIQLRDVAHIPHSVSFFFHRKRLESHNPAYQPIAEAG